MGCVDPIGLIYKIKIMKNILLSTLIFWALTCHANEALEFSCNTSKHHFYITREDRGDGVRYRSWNKPKLPTSSPDMDITHGASLSFGMGPCIHTDYQFKSGNIEYVVDDNVLCVEKSPPKNVI